MRGTVGVVRNGNVATLRTVQVGFIGRLGMIVVIVLAKLVVVMVRARISAVTVRPLRGVLFIALAFRVLVVGRRRPVEGREGGGGGGQGQVQTERGDGIKELGGEGIGVQIESARHMGLVGDGKERLARQRRGEGGEGRRTRGRKGRRGGAGGAFHERGD